MFSGHDEEFPHHFGALSNIFLHQFCSGDPDECTVCVMSHGPGKEGLARSWWAVQKDALRLRNTQGVEDLWVLDGKLDDFLDLFDLLVAATNHVVI